MRGKAERERVARADRFHRVRYIPAPADDDEMITTPDASGYMRVSPIYLKALRRKGGGPPFYRIGRLVRYKISDLDTWLEKRRVG
jgi:excisionase family DNA binding protein